jgi:membrane-bound lytic murein transglycosylase D
MLLILANTLFANIQNTTQSDLEVIKELGFETSFLYNDSLQDTLDEYSSNQNISYYNSIIRKSSLSVQIVKSEVENENLPIAAFFIPLLESHFVNQTRGKNAPSGLWQITAETATSLRLRNDEFIDERLDLIKSTDAASNYLKRYYSRFNKWYLALIAYNCGEGRVLEGVARASLDRYLELNPQMSDNETIKRYKNILANYKKNKSGFSDLYEIYNRIGKQQFAYSFEYLMNNNNRSYLPASSLEYMKKLIVFSMISNRDLFKSINNKSKYKLEKVKASKGLQLKSIATAIDMNYEEFKSINKHMKKDAIPSDSKSYNLYIPSEKLDIYNQRMFNLKPTLENKVVETKTIENKKETKTTVSKNKESKNKQQENKKETKVIESKKNVDKPIIYTIKKGDTLESIAKKNKVSIDRIKIDKNKKSNTLKIGDKIEISK